MISHLDVCPFFTKQHRLVDAAELNLVSTLDSEFFAFDVRRDGV